MVITIGFLLSRSVLPGTWWVWAAYSVLWFLLGIYVLVLWLVGLLRGRLPRVVGRPGHQPPPPPRPAEER